MIYQYGDMFSGGVGWIIATTNSYIRGDGKLVMGRGAAKQMIDRWPQVQRGFGLLVKERCGHLGKYGVILDQDIRLGIFQVKLHFRNQADLELIRLSTGRLLRIARDNPLETYNLNFPGIGNGKLSVGEVEPIISILPDNVIVWRFNR